MIAKAEVKFVRISPTKVRQVIDVLRHKDVAQAQAILANLNKRPVESLTKILKSAVANAKVLDVAAEELSAITGQHPVVTKAKKSIAAFKLRQGMPIGVTVTLRGDRMYELLDRMVNAALPRIRDFQGVSPYSFDGRGNYSLGIKEQVIFPELDYDKIDRIRGLQFTMVTSARSDEEGKRLLELMGMPFARR